MKQADFSQEGSLPNMAFGANKPFGMAFCYTQSLRFAQARLAA